MSTDWTREHWRELPGLPAPIVGGRKFQHHRWRRADINAYFDGKNFDGYPAETPAPAANDAKPDELSEWKKGLLQGL